MAIRTWTGSGSTDNWSEAANWDTGSPVNGDSVVFPDLGAAYQSINDTLDIQIYGITFPTFDPFVRVRDLTGLRIDLRGNALSDSAGPVINCPLLITVPVTITGNQQFDIGGAISGSGTINFVGETNMLAGGTFSGTMNFDGGHGLYGLYANANLTLAVSAYLSWGSAAGTYLGNITGGAGSYIDIGCTAGTLEIRGSISVPKVDFWSGTVFVASAYGFTTITASTEVNVRNGCELITDRTITTPVSNLNDSTIELSDNTTGKTLTVSGDVYLNTASSNLQFRLNGTVPANNSKLVANGASGIVFFANIYLVLIQYLNPTSGAVFTICSGTAIDITSGNFDVGPDGSVFTQQGRNFRINYTATDITITDLGTTRVWTGLGASDNWSDPNNWDSGVPFAGNDLVFAGVTRPNTVNDLAAGLTFNSITFDAGAAAFTNSGNSINLGGAITNNSTNLQTLSHAIVLTGNRNINMNSGSITLSGVTSGTGFGYNISGAGNVLLLANSMSNTGNWTVNSGTLRLASGNRLANGSSLVINSPGIFDVNGASDAVNGLSGDGLVTNLGGGTPNLTVGQANATTTFSGTVSGSMILQKNGGGTLTLSGNNTHSGGTILNTGIIIVGHNNALGSGTATIMGTAQRFQFIGGLTVPNNFVFNAGGATFNGAFMLTDTGSLSTTLSGTFTINANPAAGGHFGHAAAGTGWLNITGVITSSVTVQSRIGRVLFSGGGAGFTSFQIGEGIVRIGAVNGLPVGVSVSMGVSGVSELDLNGNNQTITGLTSGANAHSINSATAATLTVNNAANVSYTGTIVGAVALTKSNSGSLTLSNTNTYSGITTISAGSVIVTGTLSAGGGTVTVGSGGTLAGTGTITRTVIASSGSTVAPGTGGTTIGTLSTGGTDLQAGSTYSLNMNSTVPTNTDMISAGALTLAGNLVINSLINYVPGKNYRIASASSVTGTFSGLPQGSLITSGAGIFKIDYTPTEVWLRDTRRTSRFLPLFG